MKNTSTSSRFKSYLVRSEDLFEDVVGEKLSNVALVRGVELVLALEDSGAWLDRFDRLEKVRHANERTTEIQNPLAKKTQSML